MIEGVFQRTGYGAVVLRRDKEDTVRRLDGSLHPEHRRALVRVIVLIVKRKVADRHVDEIEVRRGETYQCVRDAAVDRGWGQAADYGGNPLGHR